MAIRSLNLREKNKRKKIYRVVLGAVFFVLLYAALVFLSRLSSFDLEVVTMNGLQTIDEKLITTQAMDFCSGTSFLFSRKSILVCPLSSFRRQLISEWPRIETLTISRTGFHEIELDFTERTSVGQTCSGKCFVFDTNGFLFREVLPEEKDLPVWTGTGNMIAENILPVERFRSLFDFIVLLSPVIQHPKTISIIPPDVEIVAKNEITYLIAEDADKTQTLRNITEFTKSFQKKNPNFLQTVSKIDARFGNKFFYTPKGTSTPQKSLSTSTSSTVR